ncbi:MAG: flagellar biosynthesis protein FlgD [Helicobacter sp.]|uniref:flagellar hook assembly protein FlgD n=1 Tax=Helicobacter sp. TaxID=218 RepID=UPI0023CC4210|nr:flagellar hook assembly protein FlgD [Helicobacter sp.]MDE7175409.1 flagellar biosynthesis protein FlgD [Helicobacter sp.]
MSSTTATGLNGNYQQPQTTSNTSRSSGTESAKENEWKNPLDDKEIPKDESTTGGNSLSNEAFMRLFLEQLKNQDPTAPMETQEILTQTAQLTQVEAQEKMKTAMEKMTSAMESMQETNQKTIESQEKMIESQQKMLESLGLLSDSIMDSNILNGYNSVSVIGKMAETGLDTITIEKNDKVEFGLYFDEPIDASRGNPKITIVSNTVVKGDGEKEEVEKTIVKEIDLSAYDGQSGWITFEWDTKDDGGTYVKAGDYTITAEYNLDSTTNKYLETSMGRGEVQSVIFDQGVPYVKLGEMIVPITYVYSFEPKS